MTEMGRKANVVDLCICSRRRLTSGQDRPDDEQKFESVGKEMEQELQHQGSVRHGTTCVGVGDSLRSVPIRGLFYSVPNP